MPSAQADEAVELTKRYMRNWSLSNQEALAFLDKVYPSKITFYGKQTSKSAVMREKKIYVERWPERRYSIRPHSVSVSCTANVCEVGGILDRNVYSSARNTTSTGAAKFSFTIQVGPRPLVLSESGEVLTREAHKGRFGTLETQRELLRLQQHHPRFLSKPEFLIPPLSVKSIRALGHGPVRFPT
jgi:hypothetical protein